MIHIDRVQTDETGNAIEPSEAWFHLAADSTAKAIEERGQHVADRTVYDHDEVRMALGRLFHDKCAYCESKREGWEVEHFRPKGRVAERKDHPGYYWLTYVWENLYPSCTHCNQRRKDRPRWGDPAELPAGGKFDKFPLLDESTRAMGLADDHAAEQRLLIDPCVDDPQEYLGYDPTGQIFSLRDPLGESTSDVGSRTIDVLHLKRRQLKTFRREVIVVVTAVVKLVANVAIVANPGAGSDLKALLKTIKAGGSGHAGVARYVAEHPAMFGV